MKRLFVFVPAILLVIFLLNSFVLKEKEAGEKTTEGTKSFTNVTIRDKSLIDPFAKVPVAKVNRNKSGLVNILFKSTDGGQTWQDIGEGLPAIEQPVNFFAGKSDLYLHVKNVMYRSKSNLKTPVWEKENVPDPQNASIVFDRMNVVESEGVLIARGQKGIMRSTDNGEHWQWVISEGGVGIAVERIKGGFAAISYNTETKSRRIHISLDRGKTWQAIDEGLRPSSSISSIKQMGKYLICGHPDGIFRSSDMGKTWNRVHPGADKNEFKSVTTWYSPFGGPWYSPFGKPWNSSFSEPGNVFRIYVSGNVLYAVAGSAGC